MGLFENNIDKNPEGTVYFGSVVEQNVWLQERFESDAVLNAELLQKSLQDRFDRLVRNGWSEEDAKVEVFGNV